MAKGSTDLGQHRVHSREIVESELEQVAAFLTKTFGYVDGYFLNILNALTRHATPSGFPKYGYALLCDDIIVGVILMIFAKVKSADAESVRCHVTAWSVDPGYRSYAALFFSRSLHYKNITYLSLLAIKRSLPFIELQGFSKLSDGQFAAIPIASRGASEPEVRLIRADAVPSADVDAFEQDLLLAHQSYGCLSFWCMAKDGAHPFVFQPRAFKGFLPGAQLIYCRDVSEFVRFLRPIGRFLAMHGRFLVAINSNGPIHGVVGKHFPGNQPWYFKGPKPHIGDLAYTQFTMHAPPKKTVARMWSEYWSSGSSN